MKDRRQKTEDRTEDRGRAFVMAELIVALSILGLLMAGIVVTLRGAARFDRLLWSKQQCLAAAEAQIDSLLATGHAMAPDTVSELWPGLKADVQVQPGQGQWQGLDLVKATASTANGRHEVKVTLSRYGTVRKGPLAEAR